MPTQTRCSPPLSWSPYATRDAASPRATLTLTLSLTLTLTQVTIRNPRGRELLERAVASRRVQVLREGGHGGRSLPSEGDRRAITLKTVTRAPTLTSRDKAQRSITLKTAAAGPLLERLTQS